MSFNDYSTTPASNTTIAGTNVGEGCSPAGLNDAIRQLMADGRSLADTVPDIGTDVQAYNEALESLTGVAGNGGRFARVKDDETGYQHEDLVRLAEVAGNGGKALRLATDAQSIVYGEGIEQGGTGVLSTSGQANNSNIDIPGIPAGAVEIKLNLMGLTLTGTGTSSINLLLGNSGGVVASGYSGSRLRFLPNGTRTRTGFGAGAGLNQNDRDVTGTVVLTRAAQDSDTWLINFNLTSTTVDTDVFTGAGLIDLGGEITSLRLQPAPLGVWAGSYSVTWR